jgi:phospholipid-translocating ATPase
VLTGDKVETAINIGFSAGLLDNTMQIYTCETNQEYQIEDLLSSTSQELNFVQVKSALVIAGDALTKIERSERLTKLLVEVTDKVNIVIACRVSPS